MKIFFVSIFISLSMLLSAQVVPENLVGKWTACNKDSSFFKVNEIEFHEDASYYIKANCCYYINWEIVSSRIVHIENLFSCTEPGGVSKLNAKESWKISTKNNKQEIELRRSGKLIDRFQIIEYKEVRIESYPYDTKILRLRRVSVGR